MIHARSFAVFDSNSPPSSLSELSARLLEEQKHSWPQLAEGYASLSSVKLRELRCDGYTVSLQFNPGRIVSTGAKVDEQSIRERRCFLCVPHLPPPQKGILYRDEFLVLCNPAPIFREHLTISHINHIPQLIGPFVHRFLDLARDFSPRFTVFYNGARCGASAPDHMHFQANPTGAIPVEHDAMERNRRILKKKIRESTVLSLAGYGRQVLVIESGQQHGLETVILSALESLKSVLGTSEEPMVNILASYAESAWRVILFPRSKHRPDVYFAEGDRRVLISPAAVDVGGLVITPLEKDFTSVDAAMVQSIFREVSLDQERFEETIAEI